MSVAYYSVWLVPDALDRPYFQGQITTLAERFGTVPFCPHVTLHSGLLPTTVETSGLLLPPMEPMELEVMSLDQGTHFSKTLYVQLNQSSSLIAWVDRLVAAIPNALPRPLDPHLSLLYHRPSTAERRMLATSIALPRPTIRFDQIHIMAAPQNFETQEHVASLRCVHRQWLTTL